VRLQLEATPIELFEKGEALVRELADAFSGMNPDLAESLEKALPPKESELKYAALRGLKGRTDKEYDRMIQKMLREIGKVLDLSVTGTSIQKAFTGLEPEKEEEELGTEGEAEEELEPGDYDSKNDEIVPEPEDDDDEEEKSLEKAGPFMGPRGGKWADAQHTIPWKEPSIASHRVAAITSLPEGVGSRILKTMQAVGERFPELSDVRVELSEWMRGTDVLASKSHAAVGLNPEMWTSAGKLGAFEKEWKGMLVDPSVEGVVIHEMGHVLATRALRLLGADAYNAILSKHLSDLNNIASTEATSVYGQENTAEFEAEAFVSLFHDRAEMGPFSEEALQFAKSFWADMLAAIRNHSLSKSLQSEPVQDFTKPIADQDERAYERMKSVLKNKGYNASDFEEGGPLYGYSVNELIELVRGKKAS